MPEQVKAVIPIVLIDGPLAQPAAPVERSMGGDNTVYHACEIYAGRTNYAVCLHTIKAIEESRMQLREECENAVRGKVCPALKMREEERAAGVSIYYFPRAEQARRNEERIASMQGIYGYGRGRKSSISQAEFTRTDAPYIREETAAKPKTKPVKNDDKLDADLIGRNLAGEAINLAIKESK